MNSQKIVDYVMNTPHNTNPVILRQMLDSNGGNSGGGGGTDLTAFLDGSTTTVTIPNEVINLRSGAFVGCHALESIEVSADHENYSAVDGVLYNKTGDTLVAYPVGKADAEFTVPTTVTKISDFAFCGSDLERIVLNAGITACGDNAFLDSYQNAEMVLVMDSAKLNQGGTYLNRSPEAPWQVAKIATAFVVPEDTTFISAKAFRDLSVKTLYFNALNYEVEVAEEYDSKSEEYYITSPFDSSLLYFSNPSDKFRKVVFGEGVTYIPDKMFYNCYTLRQAVIPRSVVSIGANTFYGLSERGFKIVGYAGSYAETYANENGIPFEAITE